MGRFMAVLNTILVRVFKRERYSKKTKKRETARKSTGTLNTFYKNYSPSVIVTALTSVGVPFISRRGKYSRALSGFE